MKTFVVIGVHGQGFDTEENVLYAGQDEQKAKDISPDTHYHKLYIEVWAKETLIQSYSKDDIYQWKLEFDKIKNIKVEIEKKKSELEKATQELNDLTSLLEDNG